MESKMQELMDIDSAIAYAQLAVHTLQHSATEVNAKELQKEIKCYIQNLEQQKLEDWQILLQREKVMWYVILIILLIISFTIIKYLIHKKKRRYKKVKSLSKMSKKEFKKAMKDLEIK